MMAVKLFGNVMLLYSKVSQYDTAEFQEPQNPNSKILFMYSYILLGHILSELYEVLYKHVFMEISTFCCFFPFIILGREMALVLRPTCSF